MSGRLPRLRALWQVQRRRRPAAAARVESAALALRGRAELAAVVRDLRLRVAELERDHRLLAAHVGELSGRDGGGGPVDDAIGRARLAAVAMYEERLGALEERAARSRPARGGRGPVDIGGTPDERAEVAR